MLSSILRLPTIVLTESGQAGKARDLGSRNAQVRTLSLRPFLNVRLSAMDSQSPYEGVIVPVRVRLGAP